MADPYSSPDSFSSELEADELRNRIRFMKKSSKLFGVNLIIFIPIIFGLAIKQNMDKFSELAGSSAVSLPEWTREIGQTFLSGTLLSLTTLPIVAVIIYSKLKARGYSQTLAAVEKRNKLKDTIES